MKILRKIQLHFLCRKLRRGYAARVYKQHFEFSISKVKVFVKADSSMYYAAPNGTGKIISMEELEGYPDYFLKSIPGPPVIFVVHPDSIPGQEEQT